MIDRKWQQMLKRRWNIHLNIRFLCSLSFPSSESFFFHWKKFFLSFFPPSAKTRWNGGRKICLYDLRHRFCLNCRWWKFSCTFFSSLSSWYLRFICAKVEKKEKIFISPVRRWKSFYLFYFFLFFLWRLKWESLNISS